MNTFDTNWKPTDVPVLRMFYADSGFNPDLHGGWEHFRHYAGEHWAKLQSVIHEAGQVLKRTGLDIDFEPQVGAYELDNKLAPVVTVAGIIRIGMHMVSDGDRVAIVTYPHNVNGQMHCDLDDMSEADFKNHYGYQKKDIEQVLTAADGLVISYLENSLRLVSAGQVIRPSLTLTSPVKQSMIMEMEDYLNFLDRVIQQQSDKSSHIISQRKSHRQVSAHAA